jgi:DNA ligase (NAD+)
MLTKQEKIKDLEVKINQAREDYYNGEAKVSDRVFDAWYDELKSLDPSNLAITKIGAAPSSEWEKVTHKIPMSSLNKVNTPDELIDWSNRCPKQDYLVMDKLDGLSINAIYDNGRLVQAVTRGSGTIGENIYANVKNMIGVKRIIEGFTGSLRGEILLTKSLHAKHFADKANPRNAASGVSKRLDAVGSQHLTVMFYQVIGDVDFTTEVDQLDWIKSKGLITPKYTYCKTTKDVIEVWNQYQTSIRSSLDYDIDGLVCRINNIVIQESLGELSHRPAGSIAFKFDAESRTTTIKNVVWQVGNSGRVTPVAVFDPVVLAGATISKASLYNYSYVKELQLDIGAEVLVARNNDVIPSVVEVVNGTGKTLPKPSNCPECNHSLVTEGEYILCPNIDSCPKQITGRIENWVNQLNLLEWGSTLIGRLVEEGLVKDISDLYKLTADQLSNIDRMGKKSADKCLKILWDNAQISLENFLGGLSIPMVGSSIIKMVISGGYDTLDLIQSATMQQLEDVNGLGPAKAESLYQGLIKNKELIDKLLLIGVSIKEKPTGKLVGKSFAITGTLSMKRAELEKLIEDNGGVVKSSISKDNSFLIINDTASTSSKAVNAKKNGVKLISEKQLLEMI